MKQEAPPFLFDELFRSSYGKIAAALTRKLGPDQLDLVESAIQEAFLKAIQLWPLKGNPEKPLHWLIRVAYHAAIDDLKSKKSKGVPLDGVLDFIHAPENPFHSADEIADDDLRMLFLCCHPALPKESQAALLLKTACGFSVAEIARAFLTKEEAIAQRLVRAKQKIRESKLEFELPPAKELSERIDTVSLCLYLLFNEGYGASGGESLVRQELCDEAIYLTKKLIAHSVGKTSKSYALLALFLFHQARVKTRTDSDGGILLLKDQNRSEWSKSLLDEAADYLSLSAKENQLTRYHLEAAIAACHALSPSWEETNWAQIISYYEILEQLAPSPIVTLNRIAATLMNAGPDTAHKELKKASQLLEGFRYYLYPAVVAEIYFQMGDIKKARLNYVAAFKLAGTSAEKLFLQRQIERLES